MNKISTYPLESTRVDLSGKYWIGDPCYVFSDKDWQKLCDLMFPNGSQLFDDSDTMRVVEVNGIKVYMFGTAYGDGCYALKESGETIAELGVDAGMLSLVPVELLKLRGWGKSKIYGEVVEFVSRRYTPSMDLSNGDFSYGEYSINTSGDGEDEYWDPENEY